MSQINAYVQNFPAPQTPIVDAKTGALTNDGRFLLQALFNRTGQGSGIVPSVSDPLTATGSTQGDALQLINDWNDVETVPVGSGVVIPPLKPGQDITVANGGANPLNVYPPTGARIEQLAANAAFSLTPGKTRNFQCWSLTQFRVPGN